MLRATVLSEPGSGSTTFVGLFYLALTRLGTERADTFRFNVPPEALGLLAPLYDQLVAGSFPEPVAPVDVAHIRFGLAFSPASSWRPLRRGAGFEPRYQAECRWIRTGFDTVAGLLEAGDSGPGALSDLRGSTTPIFVLGPPPPRGSLEVGAAPGSNRDSAIVRILQQLAYRAGAPRGPTGKRLHPVFVFTKMDALPGDVAPTVPRGDLLDEGHLFDNRERIGRSLIEAMIPNTAAFCRSARATVDEPVPFFSYVRTTPGQDPAGPPLLTRTLANHHHEPVFPFSQFRALIDDLGDLSRREL